MPLWHKPPARRLHDCARIAPTMLASTPTRCCFRRSRSRAFHTSSRGMVLGPVSRPTGIVRRCSWDSNRTGISRVVSLNSRIPARGVLHDPRRIHRSHVTPVEQHARPREERARAVPVRRRSAGIVEIEQCARKYAHREVTIGSQADVLTRTAAICSGHVTLCTTWRAAWRALFTRRPSSGPPRVLPEWAARCAELHTAQAHIGLGMWTNRTDLQGQKWNDRGRRDGLRA